MASRHRIGESLPAGAGVPAAAALLALVVLLVAPASVIRAQSQPPSPFEQEIKASFIYTVVKFVDWPGTAFGASDAPMVMAILGTSRSGTRSRRWSTGRG